MEAVDVVPLQQSCCPLDRGTALSMAPFGFDVNDELRTRADTFV
jgi:hypothetical protein